MKPEYKKLVNITLDKTLEFLEDIKNEAIKEKLKAESSGDIKRADYLTAQIELIIKLRDGFKNWRIE